MSKWPEKKFQTMLCDYTKAMGGYALKMSNQFKRGIPDLLLKVPGYPTCLLECKTEDAEAFKDKIPLKLEPMQRKVLRDMQKARVICGWALAHKTKDHKVMIYVGNDPGVTFVPRRWFERDSFIVPRWANAPIDQIIRSIGILTQE